MMQVYQEMQDALVKNNPFMAMMPMADEMQKNTQTMLEAFKLPEFPVFEVPGFEDLPKLAGIDMFEGNLEAMGEFFPASPVSSFGNLAAHPMAASAASSAVGAGIASATVGTWFGWMTALMDGAVKAQKATKGSSVFAPMSVEGANPMKFDWGFSAGNSAPAFNFATFEWFSTGADAAPATKKAAPAKPKAKPAKKAVAAPAPAPKPAPVAKVAAEPVVKAESAPKPAPKAEAVAPAPKAEPVKAVPAAEPVPATPVEAPASIDAPAPVETVAAAPAPSAAETQVMPEDFAKPKALEKPEAVDDLKMIAGVGPKLEKVLNGLGVWKFEQIAKWTRNEIAWVDDYLQFKGRIDRDEWLAQADALAAGGRDEYVKRFGKEPR